MSVTPLSGWIRFPRPWRRLPGAKGCQRKNSRQQTAAGRGGASEELTEQQLGGSEAPPLPDKRRRSEDTLDTRTLRKMRTDWDWEGFA